MRFLQGALWVSIGFLKISTGSLRVSVGGLSGFYA